MALGTSWSCMPTDVAYISYILFSPPTTLPPEGKVLVFVFLRNLMSNQFYAKGIKLMEIIHHNLKWFVMEIFDVKGRDNPTSTLNCHCFLYKQFTHYSPVEKIGFISLKAFMGIYPRAPFLANFLWRNILLRKECQILFKIIVPFLSQSARNHPK